MEVLQCTPQDFIENEAEWLKCLEEAHVIDAIPSLNHVDHHLIDQGKLVKFRGMVQDMDGPEFYFEKLETINPNTGDKIIKFGKYMDINDLEDDEFDNAVKSERQIYVVMSPPGINPWVKTIEESRGGNIVKPQQSTSSNSKRPIDENMMEIDENVKKVCLINPVDNTNNLVNTENLQQNFEYSDWSNYPPKELVNNSPIPTQSSRVCLLLAYKEFDNLTINTVYDFIGFIGITCNQIVKGPESTIFSIPRLHCVKFMKTTHCNPLIDNKLTLNYNRMEFIRKELLIVLTQLVFGDELTAEYLLYNLISSVYTRRSQLALGKFCLNISNIPKLDSLDFVVEFYKFIELLATKSHYFAMSLENIKNMTFTAKKDFSSNILKSSLLQLSPHTHLILDETKLSTGQLNENGLMNIRAIDNAIKHQKTICDFTYYKIEFDCDIVFLIFSQAKSMLSSDCHVVLQPDDQSVRTFKEITEAARHFLKPELLAEIRMYLSMARLINYEISDDISELIQNEYVEMRQKSQLCGGDLHHLLVLSRLIAVSQGKSSLDYDSWRKACNLEEVRKQRLPTK